MPDPKKKNSMAKEIPLLFSPEAKYDLGFEKRIASKVKCPVSQSHFIPFVLGAQKLFVPRITFNADNFSAEINDGCKKWNTLKDSKRIESSFLFSNYSEVNKKQAV